MFFNHDKSEKDDASASSSAASMQQRRSAARAKPARAAASSVREAPATTPGYAASKKEQTAARLRSRDRKAERRIDENRVNYLIDIQLKSNPTYAKSRRIWQVSIGLTLACTLVTLILSTMSGGGQSVAIAETVAIVLAYAFVIFALIWDWVRVRPLRNAARDKAYSMSERAQERLIAQFEDQEEEREKQNKGKRE
jgi:hypothetical protein